MKQLNINQTHSPKSSPKAFIDWATLNTSKNFFELSPALLRDAAMKSRIMRDVTCLIPAPKAGPLYGWEFYSANGIDKQESSALNSKFSAIIINCINQFDFHAAAQYH